MDLNTRIQKIIEYTLLSPSEFAEEIGVQRSNISHILSGRNKPSLDFIMKIKDKFPEIQWEWIIEGKGNMTLASPTSTIKPTSSKINEEEKEQFEPIPNLFTNMDPSTKEINNEEGVIKKINSISNSQISRELNILDDTKKQNEIANSQPLETKSEHPKEFKIEKIVFFYENGKFEVFIP